MLNLCYVPIIESLFIITTKNQLNNKKYNKYLHIISMLQYYVTYFTHLILNKRLCFFYDNIK